VDHKAGLDKKEKWKFLTLPGLEICSVCGPARSQLHTDLTTAALNKAGNMAVSQPATCIAFCSLMANMSSSPLMATSVARGKSNG
jgi:hypothetical protein